MELLSLEWLALLLAAGFILAVGIMVFMITSEVTSDKDVHIIDKDVRIVELETRLENECARCEEAKKSVEKLHEQLHADSASSASTIAELRATLVNTQKNAQEKIDLLQEARESLTMEFQNLSQSILEENSKKFGADSKKLLGPLTDNLAEFRKRIDVIHADDLKQRSTLENEIKNLHNNATQISRDANNLARALKGESKTQGDWGEVELAALLEKAGLREGEGYESQKSLHDDDKNKYRPDVVIKLPGERHFVVDSKISLRAFTDAMATDNEDEKKVLLKSHAQAVRKHVTDLAAKNYQNLRGINAPDMVFMFMAVEPAFIAALMEDGNLFHEAYQKGVVLCSPTTLMPVLRSTEHIWRLDRQNRNADEIAKRGAALYDKLVGFAEDMDKVGASLNKARETYDNANKKLRYGNNNLYSQAQKLIELGVSPSKKLPFDK